MKTKILFVLIIFVAVFLRFYQLGTNPPFLNWDEAAWGYNAYSVGIDGKDEFGRFLPHDYIESFGDFKPPVYLYAAVLPVKIFGLNAFATRFPSAFFGVLTVVITYFLVKRIFPNSPYKKWYAFLTMFILAISPWHIMLSRAAFEANVALFFIVSGVWLFLGAVQEKPWYLIFSAISFVLSLYTFNTPRIVAPLLVLFLSLAFWRRLIKIKKYVVFAVIIGICLALPTIPFLLSPQAKLRFQEVNIFTDSVTIQKINQYVQNDNNSSFSKAIHNRRIVFSVLFLKHYFDNLNFSFLFINGDQNPKFSIQDIGQMYLWDLPFFIIGILFIFRKREGEWWVVPMWLILGIIPAATARETPHALRTEITLPTFQIFVAYGLVTAYLWLEKFVKNKRYQKGIIAVVFALLIISVVYFQHSYYTYYSYKYSGDWNYTYKDSIAYVEKVQGKYNKIAITDTLGRPYIYYLFYLHINPNDFRMTANIQHDPFGFVHVNSFGKYYFRSGPSGIKGQNILYIDQFGDMPAKAHILKKFTDIDGTPILVAYTL